MNTLKSDNQLSGITRKILNLKIKPVRDQQ